jgi:hypothetical protein
MAFALDPAVAAHHRRGDRDRLAEHHQISRRDPPGLAGNQGVPLENRIRLVTCESS